MQFKLADNHYQTHLTRVVKRSSDLRTSNFKFESVFFFQPFDIRIQADGFALKVERCYFSGALCDDFFVLCRPSIQVTPAACLLTPLLPSLPCLPPRRSITLRAAPLVRVVYWCKQSKWQILEAQTQSRRQLMAIEHDMAWRPGWLHCW